MNSKPNRRPRTRKESSVRLEEILDAAMKLFGERGFWGTSLQDVADECHFTVTGILYHVGSKEALMEAVLAAMDTRLFVSAAEELGVDPTGFRLGAPIEGGVDIARLFRVLVRVTIRDPRAAFVYSVMENESTDPAHPAHEYFRTREAVAVESYASTVPEGFGDPEMVARMAMGLLSGLHVQWLRDPMGTDLVSLWEDVVAGIPALEGGYAHD